MNDETSNKEDKKTEELKESASNIGLKILDALKKKYHFSFDIYGWIIALAAVILLILILK